MPVPYLVPSQSVTMEIKSKTKRLKNNFHLQRESSESSTLLDLFHIVHS